MENIYHIATAVGLVAMLLAAGIVLRTLAAVVQTYASRFGTPRLATIIRVTGIIFMGIGSWMICLAAIAVLMAEVQFKERILATAGFLTAGYFLFAGMALFAWGFRLSRPVSGHAYEIECRLVISLAWFSGVMCIGVCVAAFFEPPILFGLLPLLILLLGLLLPLEFVVSWGRSAQRQLWELWQICVALRGHRPLAEELLMLSDYSWGAQRRRMREMSEELHDGATAEDVFVRPTFLSAIEGSQLSTGMKSGRLPEVLRDLLAQRTARANEMLGLQDSLYTGVHLCFSLLILAAVSRFIMIFIIPKFIRIFDDFGVDLPPLTQAVFSQSDWLSASSQMVLLAFTMLAVVAAGAAALPILASFPRVREQLTRLWPRLCLPEILKSLSYAVGAREPLEEALVPFVRRQFQIPLHSRLVRVQEAVREGADCWSEMAVEKLLTPTEAGLLQSAQRAGNLPWAMRAIGQRYERQWRFWLAFGLEFVQPALLLCVGSLVFLFVVALFLPLVSLIHDLA